MKSRLAAAIALYFLLTLLFSTLSTTSSRHEVFEQKWKTFSRLLVEKINSRITQTLSLPQLKNNILSLVINEFLTCKDISVLRQTCYDFQYLLHPNDAHMVTFCVYGFSKTMATNIIWEDLKHFMKQSYYSAFDEMKMFNIKENKYAVLTRVPEEKYIVWNNESIPYHQMLLDETTQYTPYTNPQNYYEKHFEPIKSCGAWAIITKSRNVKTGGDPKAGGDSSIVESQLVNVQRIISNDHAFAALLDNGTVVAWGNENYGGKIPDEIKTQLVKVQMILSTNMSFSALLDNGTVVAWGGKNHGGEIPDEIQAQLVNVQMIFSTNTAYAALLDNSTVVVWGNKTFGGKIPDEIQPQLVNVKIIFSTIFAFAALLNNGTVVVWGDENNGGKISRDIPKQMIKNVKMIFSTAFAFAALLNDGTVVAWGKEDYGGKIPDDIKTYLIDVKQIFPKLKTFTALCKNGTILTWGDN